MRTLDANLKAATQLKFTEPVWLVYLDFGSTVKRASSREQIEWAGESWVQLGLEVGQVTNDFMEFSLDNSDKATSILALTNDIKGNTLQAWLHYAGYSQLRFTGILDSWNLRAGGQRVSFSGSSIAAKDGKFPPVVISEGIWNHIPPPGTVIKAGGQAIVLESTPQ